MPRIRPYESQVSSQGDVPSRNAGLQDFGGAGLANLGQGIENLGQGVGQARRILNDVQARQEVTDAHVAISRAEHTLTQEVNEAHRTWTPDQPPLSERFLEKFKTTLDALHLNEDGTERYETAAGRQTHARLAQALGVQVANMLMTADTDLAGKAAILRHTEHVDAVSNFLQLNPGQFARQQADTAAMLHDPSGEYGRLPTVLQDKMTREATEKFALSAVQGLIGQDPKATLGRLIDPGLAKGEYSWIATSIPSEKFPVLINQAETQVRAVEADARQAVAEERRRITDLHHTTDAALMAQHELSRQRVKGADGKPIPPLRPTDVAFAMLPDENGVSRLDGPTGRAIINMLNEEARRGPTPTHTNPAVEHDLFRRIHLPDDDPRKITDTGPIYDAFLENKLSATTRDNLRRELVEARSPEGSVFGREKAEFLKGIEPQITKPGPFGIYADPTTPEQFSRFKRDLETSIAAYRKQGKDPRTLFDFNSPDYFGKRARQYTTQGFGSLQPAPETPSTTRKSLDDIFGGKR